MSAGSSGRVVVIGSGPSGAIAADRLSRAGVAVTLLEAGVEPAGGLIVRVGGQTVLRRQPDDGVLADRHVAVDDPLTEWFSALQLGGLSNHWTAAVPRFAAEDFTDGARLDERFRWPLTYDELRPWYEVAEEHLTISGPERSIPVMPAGLVRYPREVPADWRALMAPAHTEEFTVLPLARGRPFMVVRRGSEFNSYHVILRPLLARKRIDLRLGARATRIVVGADGLATGVEYVERGTGAVITIEARAVVVAAGTIDSTRLLLASASPSAPRGVGNERGLVGRYLHDHTRTWWSFEAERPLRLVDHPLYLAREGFASSAPLSGASCTVGLAKGGSYRVGALLGRQARRFGVQVFGTVVPTDEVGVSLGDEAAGAPNDSRLRISARYDAAALAVLDRAASRFEAVLADGGNPIRISSGDWQPRPGSSVHYAGSARMHASEEFGVLDEWNRVRTSPNVLVVDMAAFTTNPEKNPTLTAMALSARAADHLASAW